MIADSNAQKLLAIVNGSPRCMAASKIARHLQLPDWAIGAGFIGAAVWDNLSGFTMPTPVDDIDLLYFNPARLDPNYDALLEDKLNSASPGIPWNIRNQARMHLRNADAPYASTAHALQSWLETPTCIAMRLLESGDFIITAPFGLEDLFSMTIRPTPRGGQRENAYLNRINSKRWQLKWPRATVELP